MRLFQHISSSKIKYSLKLALHHDKNKPLSHTAQNTERTMHLSNNPKCYLFTAMPMLHSSKGE